MARPSVAVVSATTAQRAGPPWPVRANSKPAGAAPTVILSMAIMMAPVWEKPAEPAHARAQASATAVRICLIERKSRGLLPSTRNLLGERVLRSAWTVCRLMGSSAFPHSLKSSANSSVAQPAQNPPRRGMFRRPVRAAMTRGARNFTPGFSGPSRQARSAPGSARPARARRQKITLKARVGVRLQKSFRIGRVPPKSSQRHSQIDSAGPCGTYHNRKSVACSVMSPVIVTCNSAAAVFPSVSA